MTTDQVQTTPDPWGPARLAQLNAAIEASSIAEYGRLKAEQERDKANDQRNLVLLELDRYKAALERIAGLRFPDDGEAIDRAREALQQEQA